MAVPGIAKGASGQPGTVAYPSGLTTGIFNELNMVIPDWIPKLIAKYGNDSYMLVSEILGKSVVEEQTTTTNTYSHFERSRIFGSGLVSVAVTGVLPNAAITVTFQSPQSYNDAAGDQSPFLNNQTIKIRSNGNKAILTNINRTVNGAFTAILTPLGNYALITGYSGTTLNAGEGLETFGNQLAGQASDSQGTQQPKLYRYDNTATVLRASVLSSDLASMNKTQIDFGEGNNYLPYLAVKAMNMQMMVSIEDAVLEGVPYSNAGNDTDAQPYIGTQGCIPAVTARGTEVDYIQFNFTIPDFQNMTKVWDWQGGPAEYHGVQELSQRQDINNLLFGKYPNGAITYGSVGFGQEASVAYGFQSFSTDTYSIHFHRYKGFSAPSVFGYVPTQGDYRAFFGLFVPQGDVADAKLNVSRPYMQWVYQRNPDLPMGTKIYSWELGFTKASKTSQAQNKYEQIAWVGSRVTAAEQFTILSGKQQ
jgi:hypothetical protein